MNLRKMWAIAQAERRIVLSQFIYWLFVGFAYLQTLVTFVVQGLLHATYSTLSTGSDFPTPRNAIFAIGYQYLLIFVLALVYLSSDVRARDGRVRILEILDSRPYSNLDLMMGRFLGWFLCAWVPVLVLVAILPVLGWFLPYIHIAAGGTVEPLALVGLAVYMALPAFAFVCSLVMLLTLVIRQRIAALAVALLLLAISFYLLFFKPYALSLTFDLFGFLQVNQPSEWVPSIAAPHWWWQRGGMVIMALGFVIACAVIHPRLDGAKRLAQSIAAILVIAAGVSLVLTAQQRQNQEFEQIAQWRLAHEARSRDPEASIESIQASVELMPGESLLVETRIRVQSTAAVESSSLLLTLNPGFGNLLIKDEQGRELDYNFENGLLDIQLDKARQNSRFNPNEQRSQLLSLSYSGLPDVRFAYLDSALNISAISQLVYDRSSLVRENAIFEESYVALMPGIHWLPAVGTDITQEQDYSNANDFFQLDLTVTVPESWIVAGPDQRTEVGSGNGSVSYRFKPATKISEVAILAAAFESFTTEIAGTEFELLLHPQHTAVIPAMAAAQTEIEDWIADRLRLISDTGLEYPFEKFSLVEVPNTLRSYKGGWRMDTAFAPASMVLLEESGFPSARFDVPAGSLDQIFRNTTTEVAEEDPAIAARNRLLQFFSNDFSGSNLFLAFAKSLFENQARATGEEAIALEFALAELSHMLVASERSFFSIHHLSDIYERMDQLMDDDFQQYKSTRQKVIESYTSNPQVWEAALASPLVALDPWLDSALANDVLALKSGKLAEVLYDLLGPQQSGQLLNQLLANKRGGSYTLQDVTNTQVAKEYNLAPLIERWLTDSGLAGFVADDVALTQLSENENGESRYQLKLRLNNTESVTGFSRLAWSTEADGQLSYSDPISLPGNSAVEFGLVLTEPPAAAYLDPYLSLNRLPYRLQTFVDTDVRAVNDVPFDGVQTIAMVADNSDRIIVDDLDDGFRIQERDFQGNTGILTPFLDVSDPIYDAGLPLREFGFSSRWSRRIVESAYGKYRHTVAYASRSDTPSKAIFEAQITKSGKWRLEIYHPSDVFRFGYNNLYGNVSINVVQAEESESLVWDSAAAVSGWNRLSEFDLEAGAVSVELNNDTDGRVIVADAISWTFIE